MARQSFHYHYGKQHNWRKEIYGNKYHNGLNHQIQMIVLKNIGYLSI
eukprot:gene46786-62596_t